jgi:hypothetical protein
VRIETRWRTTCVATKDNNKSKNPMKEKIKTNLDFSDLLIEIAVVFPRRPTPDTPRPTRWGAGCQFTLFCVSFGDRTPLTLRPLTC